MPNLPIFFVAVPVQLIIQLAVLAIAMTGMMLVYLNHFESSLLNFGAS